MLIKIGRWIVKKQNLVLPVVKIYKKCLQTASFCGDFVTQTHYRGFTPGPHWGEPQSYSSPNENFCRRHCIVSFYFALLLRVLLCCILHEMTFNCVDRCVSPAIVLYTNYHAYHVDDDWWRGWNWFVVWRMCRVHCHWQRLTLVDTLC